MSDGPYAIVISRSPVRLPQLSSYPYRLALLPEGVTVAMLENELATIAIFTMDSGGADEVLNGAALAGYLANRVLAILYARRPRTPAIPGSCRSV